uniref:Uncharacterized protein n=1 Tax=Panagrolaimus sp. PS1159 TaxID=55785 RepID=A0AC35EYU0_9BILA
MSAPLVISQIDFINNPANWKDSYKVQIEFEAHEELPKDAEWQLIYVGSPKDESYDQMLESVVVGPIKKGRHKFEFEADAPDDSKIPPENIQDITLLLLKCLYDGKMFSKIGWFVTNEYVDDEELQMNKPAKPILEKLKRQIQTDDVRVTNYTCAWREEEPPVIENFDDGEIAFTTGEEPVSEEEETDEDEDDDDEGEKDLAAEVSQDVDMLNINDENGVKKEDDVAMAEDDGGKGDAAMAGEVFAEKTNV